MMSVKYSQVQSPAPPDIHVDGKVIGWPEQDVWDDPKGPFGVDRPSPQLAPLTADSPQWLRDLHQNGVSTDFEMQILLESLLKHVFSGL